MRAGWLAGAACACALATGALVGGCGPLGPSEEEQRAAQEKRQRAVAATLDAGCREALRRFAARKRKIPSIRNTKLLRRQLRSGGTRFAARTRRTGVSLLELAPALDTTRGLEGEYDARRDAARKAVKALGDEYTSLFAALNSTGGYDRDRARVARLRKKVRTLRVAGRKLGAKRCAVRTTRFVDPVLAQRYAAALGRLGGRIVRASRRVIEQEATTPAALSAQMRKAERIFLRGRRELAVIVPPSPIVPQHRRYMADLAKLRRRFAEIRRLIDQGSYGMVVTRANQLIAAGKFVERHERQLFTDTFKLVG